MTETAAETAAEAAEASAEAAEAAAEAAEAEAHADDDQGDDGDGDTTVVVVDDGGNDEGAQDDATQLDHEQRITRLEERVNAVETTAAEAAMRAEVAEMVNNHSHEEVIDAARAEAAAVAEAAAEATVEAEETGEPASVRVEEPPPGAGGDIVTVSPEVPEAAEEPGRKRSSLFRW